MTVGLSSASTITGTHKPYAVQRVVFRRDCTVDHSSVWKPREECSQHVIGRDWRCFVTHSIII